ncbi:hypothetical protein UFOVP347_35 [uncultured Caudovirales phage]|uniref:Internal virion protein B n=1 Tax=uncultured Caudovirales phage TaxID=2100421 RepID=A0A6J5LZT7_9CAUD|nr:hypothetical protein UFOVP347_35 [uncultured Caudovirales phage]
MCDPISLTMGALAIGSQVVGFMGQQQAADDANQAANENARRAREDAIRGYEATNQRIEQERNAAANQAEDQRREAQRTTASTIVRAGENGVGGLSVDALLGDIVGRRLDASNRTFENLDNTVAQLEREKRGVRAQAEDRIASQPGVRGPSGLGLALGIAQAGASSYAGYQNRQTQQRIAARGGR